MNIGGTTIHGGLKDLMKQFHGGRIPDICFESQLGKRSGE
jgi:hypothetical protein